MIQSNQEYPDLSHFKDNHIHYTQLKHIQLVTFLSRFGDCSYLFLLVFFFFTTFSFSVIPYSTVARCFSHVIPLVYPMQERRENHNFHSLHK